MTAGARDGGTTKRSSGTLLRAELAGGQTVTTAWNMGPPSNASTSDVMELLPVASRELLYAPNPALNEQYLRPTPEFLARELMNMNSREMLDGTTTPSQQQEFLVGRERELRWADAVRTRGEDDGDGSAAFLMASPGATTGASTNSRTPSHQLYANQNAFPSPAAAAVSLPGGPVVSYSRLQSLSSAHAAGLIPNGGLGSFATAPSTPAALVRYMSVPTRDMSDAADAYTDQQIHIVSGAGECTNCALY